MEPLVLSPKDAANFIGLSKSRLYELIGDGTIEARKLGSRTVVPIKALKEFVASAPLVRPLLAEAAPITEIHIVRPTYD